MKFYSYNLKAGDYKTLINCTYEQHAEPIPAILNEAIENSTAIYDCQTRPARSMVLWFKEKEIGHYPVVGYASESGELLGFVTFGVNLRAKLSTPVC